MRHRGTGSFCVHGDMHQPLQTRAGSQERLCLSLPRLAFKDARDRRAFCESLLMIVTS